MKIFILIIGVLFSSVCFGQKNFNSDSILFRDGSWDDLVLRIPNLTSVTGINEDTIFVPAGQYKFIKIGDNVYKITTDIQKVGAVKSDWPITDPNFWQANPDGKVLYFNPCDTTKPNRFTRAGLSIEMPATIDLNDRRFNVDDISPLEYHSKKKN